MAAALAGSAAREFSEQSGAAFPQTPVHRRGVGGVGGRPAATGVCSDRQFLGAIGRLLLGYFLTLPDQTCGRRGNARHEADQSERFLEVLGRCPLTLSRSRRRRTISLSHHGPLAATSSPSLVLTGC
jgi:hypothetical protein